MKINRLLTNLCLDDLPKTRDFYGQRRMLLTDPNGVLVDVSSPMSNFNG